MSLLAAKVNMDGSTDSEYRYTMPALDVKHEGSSKMKKSVLVNLREVSRDVGRPAEHLLTYLGQQLNAASKVEQDKNCIKAYVTGHHDVSEIQQHILNFIQEFVMCQHCDNPETSCHLEGKKKHKTVFLTCKSCGRRTDLDSTNRFVKHMAQHLPQDIVKGHAKASSGATVAAMMSTGELADAQQAEKSKQKQSRDKQDCPNPKCGHKSSKAVCSKCGTMMCRDSEAAPVLDVSNALEDQGCHANDVTDAFNKKGCLDCIQQWMHDNQDAHTSSELIADFDATVTSHDFRTPVDVQLAALIEVVAADITNACDLTAQTQQPLTISQKAKPFVGKWSSLIDHVHGRISDKQTGLEIMFSAIRKVIVHVSILEITKDVFVIGIILSLRDHLDTITDENLLSACRRLPARSKAMEKFIKFLEEENDEEDDEESGAE